MDQRPVFVTDEDPPSDEPTPDVVSSYPTSYDQAVRAASAADREWFARHPSAERYVRDIVPGEFWPLRYPDHARVAVAKLPDGRRLRHSLAQRVGAYDPVEATRCLGNLTELPGRLTRRVIA